MRTPICIAHFADLFKPPDSLDVGGWILVGSVRESPLARLLIITARSVMCGCERERERGTERRGCSLVSAALTLSDSRISQ